jgi:hypothetical protein
VSRHRFQSFSSTQSTSVSNNFAIAANSISRSIPRIAIAVVRVSINFKVIQEIGIRAYDGFVPRRSINDSASRLSVSFADLFFQDIFGQLATALGQVFISYGVVCLHRPFALRAKRRRSHIRTRRSANLLRRAACLSWLRKLLCCANGSDRSFCKRSYPVTVTHYDFRKQFMSSVNQEFASPPLLDVRRWLVRKLSIVCLFAFSFAAAPRHSSAEAEQVDDRGYPYWAKFKSGSVAKTTTETGLGEQKMTMPMTTTLLTVTAENITVEVKNEVESGGTKIAPSIKQRAVSVKRAKPDKPPQSTKEGKDDVTVGGKTCACPFLEQTRETMRIKTWMSDDVSGGLVKLELTDGESKMKMNLVEYTIKK